MTRSLTRKLEPGRRDERGAILVITVILLTALLAVTGLVVDIGNGRQQRRNVQNYVDASTLAGLNALIPKNPVSAPDADVIAAAAASLAANGLPADTGWIRHPPTTGEHQGDPGCVEVVADTEVPLTFAAVVSGGPLDVSARAVGCLEKLSEAVPVIFGAALECSNNVQLTASGTIDGGIHSNADLNFGSNSIEIIGATTYSGGPPQNDDNVIYDPPAPANPVAVPVQQIPYELSAADIGAITAAAAAAGQLHDAGAGVIDNAWLNLPPGPGEAPRLENVSGRDVLASGVYVTTANPPGNGSDAIDIPSSIRLDGSYTFIAVNGSVQLNAGPGAVIQHWDDSEKKLLVYSGRSNACGTDVVTVTGDDALWSGVIFAPFGSVTMKLSCSSASSTACGNGSNPTFEGAIMAWSVNLGGSGAYISSLGGLERTVVGPLLKE